MKYTFEPVMSICRTCKQRFGINFAFVPDYNGFSLLPCKFEPGGLAVASNRNQLNPKNIPQT
jgi:hypothetical protein